MELIQIETNVRWNLVEVLNVQNVLGTEGFEPVWRQAAADERGQVVEALLEVVHGIVGCLEDLFIIPDICVQAEVLNVSSFVILGCDRLSSEEFALTFVVASFLDQVFFVDVDGKNACAGGHLTWSVVQELCII